MAGFACFVRHALAASDALWYDAVGLGEGASSCCGSGSGLSLGSTNRTDVGGSRVVSDRLRKKCLSLNLFSGVNEVVVVDRQEELC
eukprot:scaffold132648_cov24-Tisochrysis_lutea.AAC.1